MNLSEYVGIPYRDAGRSRDGADCWGLAALVFDEVFGIALPAHPDGYTRPESAAARAAIAELSETIRRDLFVQIPAGAEETGDLVLMRIGGAPCHVGVVVVPGSMLSVRQGQTSVIESYRAMVWRSRVEGFYRYRG